MLTGSLMGNTPVCTIHSIIISEIPHNDDSQGHRTVSVKADIVVLLS